MNEIQWLGFAPVDALSKTYLHFYPAPPAGVAPYPVQCTLTLFGTGTDSQSVMLDGARLSQPDGVRLEDAFPTLKDSQKPFVGIHFSMAPSQHRADVSGSSCLLEFATRERSMRFRPHSITPKTDNRRPSYPILRDSFLTTSLIILNSSDEPFECNFSVSFHQSNGSRGLEKLTHRSEGAGVQEIASALPFLDHAVAQECGWGVLRSATVELEGSLPPSAAVFVVNRDAHSKRICSVNAL